MRLIFQLKTLLNSGGFEPHKWHSNCKDILNSAQDNDRIVESSVAIDALSRH